MDTSQMRAFLEVANCLNITSAASHLYMSQSALSRQIIAIERELNMQLFVRQKNKLALTPAGSSLAISLRDVSLLYNSAVNEAQLVNAQLDGVVVIGVEEYMYVDDILCDVVKAFTKDYPRVDLRLIPVGSHSLEGLYRGELDLVLCKRYVLEGHGFTYRVLDEFPPLLVMSRDHPMAGCDKVDLKDFKNDRFIFARPTSDKMINERFLKVCRKHGFVPNCAYVGNMYEINIFVGAGLGVSISHKRTYLSELQTLVTSEMEIVGDPSLCLAWNDANENEYGKLLLEYFN